jgi:hypothetical protein
MMHGQRNIKFKQVLYFLCNKQVVPQFELCMGMLASCCAKLSVHHETSAHVSAVKQEVFYIFSLWNFQRNWSYCLYFFDRIWGPLDRLHETGQFQLTTHWKKSFVSRKEKADKLTCKWLYPTGNWKFLEKLTFAALAIFFYVIRIFITIITTTSHWKYPHTNSIQILTSCSFQSYA